MTQPVSSLTPVANGNHHEAVNILLVDDQPAKLLSYEAMLNQLGENLIKANSAKEALDHLLRNEITVVLMDVSMPDIDGFELAEIIRGHPRYQKTAIIFVSAVHLTDLDRLKGYESGAVDYVAVPVVPELLRAKVSVFTELYRKTRESERLNRELEQRVAERTAALEAASAKQEALTQQLREADHRKDEFLALLAHELRNPLASVRNAAGIMRAKETKDPELIWCREVIERQADQLTRLVDDLLDVSRITQGKIKLRLQPFDLAEAVSCAVETSRALVEKQHHQLVVRLPDEKISIDGDLTRITQVIGNLLTNAAKYQNERGRIDLIVEKMGTMVAITVRDQGIGIAPEMLTQIFELFAQGERSLDRAQGGLGIGLSLVKSLVEMHGGMVTAASAGPGKGSEFTVRIPCRSEELRADAAVVEHPTSTNGKPRRILVVDDNQDAADSLTMLMQMRGFDVRVAYDGQTAIDVATSEKPAVILLDIGLPGIDGYEVCRRMRQQGLSDTCIIALTGYGQDRDRERSKEAGFDLHTVKPVKIDELLRLIADS
ncbi:MAG TPA: response regulator [Candidatus Limnocylindrales bacterium]|nr:response regulator [Candidatus Limnocylindrales bacterium]